jgi:hypothetical protein
VVRSKAEARAWELIRSAQHEDPEVWQQKSQLRLQAIAEAVAVDL